MPSSRTIASPGQDIELFIQFRDSAGDLATASGVSVKIFDPSGDFNNDATAYTTLTPVSAGVGLYRVSFTVPTNGTEGTWYDKWYGTVDEQHLEQVFSFNVINSGTIEYTDLKNNNVITVTLDKDIASADGDTLGEDYAFYFTTEYTPTYTNYNQIMLEIGRYIANVPEDTVWRLILSASLDADRLARRDPENSDESEWFEFARRSWVRCRVEEMLLVEALQEYDIKRKRLGDLDVTWNTEGIGNALDRALACKDKWLPSLESGGIKIKRAKHFIKGLYDPDKPTFGRDYIDASDPYDPYKRTPAANTKYYTNRYYRRTKKGYGRKW